MSFFERWIIGNFLEKLEKPTKALPKKTFGKFGKPHQ
jgi:hypothetical protein